MTDPGRIAATISLRMSTGALRPGIAAVVTMTSASETAFATIACSCFFSSSVSSRAYPPAPSALIWSSRNFAPRLRTCSPAARRTSYPSTIAPIRFAVSIANRPATPAPKMRTLAGRIVPAAVVSIGRNFGDRLAPMSMAR